MLTCWKPIKLRHCLCCCICAYPFFAAQVYAQNPIPLDNLLFEAYPVDAVIPVPVPATVAPANLAVVSAEQEAENEITIDRYLESIAATEASTGPFAPVLLEQYLSLGETYQQNDRHAEAITAFEKAEYISRINSGLFAVEQFDIVENLITSYMATGEHSKAADKQQYLLFLSRQNFGENSVQAVPLLRKLGDWQMAAFSSGINADSQFSISIGSSRSFTPAQLAFNSLYLAQNIYFQAINNLIASNQTANPVLPELEMKLIETMFLAANRSGLLDNPDFYLDWRPTRTGSRIMRRDLSGFSTSFANGRNAYTRLRLYEEYQPDTDVMAVARTMVGLADWNLLFNRAPSALRLYQETDAYLRSHNIPENVIADMLNPEVPEQLPVFTPLPHSREKFGIDTQTPLKFAGYIDVHFRLSRFGNVSKLEITGTNGTLAKGMERRLRRLLHISPFRPRIRDGKAVTSEVDMRYYYADARTTPTSSGM